MSYFMFCFVLSFRKGCNSIFNKSQKKVRQQNKNTHFYKDFVLLKCPGDLESKPPYNFKKKTSHSHEILVGSTTRFRRQVTVDPPNPTFQVASAPTSCDTTAPKIRGRYITNPKSLNISVCLQRLWSPQNGSVSMIPCTTNQSF